MIFPTSFCLTYRAVCTSGFVTLLIGCFFIGVHQSINIGAKKRIENII